MSDEKKPKAVEPLRGVSEATVPFEARVDDDWAIERERWAEYQRTGESLDGEEVLEAFLRRVRDRASGKA